MVEKLGHVPLPPYIAREDRQEDRERYQTVYARAETTGSVAAPTAGLHFTPQILADIRSRGIEIAELTLHVGLGTFQPVHVENVEEHKLHRESYSISEAAAAQINRALAEKRRVVAVGTTTVRTLEFAASQNRFECRWNSDCKRRLRRSRYLHLSRIPVPRGQRPAYEFPSAKIHVADAGFCLCRTGKCVASL